MASGHAYWARDCIGTRMIKRRNSHHALYQSRILSITNSQFVTVGSRSWMAQLPTPCVLTKQSIFWRRNFHYNDVIMSTMASQITSVSIACSSVCSGADYRKHQSSALLAFVRGIHQWPVNSPPSEFPAQRASNTENGFVWWRHHELHFLEWKMSDCGWHLTARVKWRYTHHWFR